ncbi:uncharacterized protein LOC144137932 isoform X2 [Haemaphysalis longicornis]
MNLQDLMSSRLLLTLLTLDQIEELMLILMAREEEEDSGGSSESSEEQSSEPSQQRGWRPTMSINDILSNPLLMAIMTSRQISDLMYVRLLQTIRDDDSCSSTSSSESADPEREERQRRRLVRRRPLRDRRSIVAREADGAGSGSGTRPDSEDSTDCEQEGRHLGRTPCRATQGCKRTASDGERVSKVAKRVGDSAPGPQCDPEQRQEARQQDVCALPQPQEARGQNCRQGGVQEEGGQAADGADER